MTYAFLFSGQGSQSVGMGKDLADNHVTAHRVFQEVDEALSQHLFRLICDGSEHELRQTENAQPAIMAVSVAAYRCYQQEHGGSIQARYHAGHSLGEYAALVCADALALDACARLLRLRGRAMQQAVAEGTGAMAAILGIDIATTEQATQAAAKQTQQCVVVANHNMPEQIVIAGHADAVATACEQAKALGAKKTIPLAVSAPFHCPLMQPAQDTMAQALATTAITAPKPPILSNVTAQACDKPTVLRDLLAKQITAMVRWCDIMQFLNHNGITQAIEFGPTTDSDNDAETIHNHYQHQHRQRYRKP